MLRSHDELLRQIASAAPARAKAADLQVEPITLAIDGAYLLGLAALSKVSGSEEKGLMIAPGFPGLAMRSVSWAWTRRARSARCWRDSRCRAASAGSASGRSFRRLRAHVLGSSCRRRRKWAKPAGPTASHRRRAAAATEALLQAGAAACRTRAGAGDPQGSQRQDQYVSSRRCSREVWRRRFLQRLRTGWILSWMSSLKSRTWTGRTRPSRLQPTQEV